MEIKIGANTYHPACKEEGEVIRQTSMVVGRAKRIATATKMITARKFDKDGVLFCEIVEKTNNVKHFVYVIV